jgi:predicted small secreted protein
MLNIERLIAFTFIIALTACNTVAGIGEDITASADWAKQKLAGSNKPIEEQKKSATQSDTSSSGNASVNK